MAATAWGMDRGQGWEVPAEKVLAKNKEWGEEGFIGEDLGKNPGSGKEVTVVEVLEVDRDQDEAVQEAEVLGMEEPLCHTPDMLIIQVLSILRKHGRKDTRGKFS